MIMRDLSWQLVSALDSKQDVQICDALENFDGLKLSYFLLTVNLEQIKKIISLVDVRVLSDILINAVPDVKAKILDFLDELLLKEAVWVMRPVGVMNFLEGLNEEHKILILSILTSHPNAHAIESMLAHPHNSIGRVICHDVIVVHEYWNVGEIKDFIKHRGEKMHGFYVIFVVTASMLPIGYIGLDRILCCKDEVVVSDIMSRDIKILNVSCSKEDVAHIVRGYAILSLAVVNEDGKLIGAINFNDLTGILENEIAQDALHLGMVSDQDITLPMTKTITKRLPWLVLNLLTATASSLVIGVFSNVLDKMVILSIIMPIIASMTGNAGLQSLTVTIRALSTKHLNSRNALKVLFKEFGVGFCNGLVMAVISMTILTIRFNYSKVNVIFCLVMVLTFSISTVIGSAVPLLLERLGFDSALSSSIIICATSDMMSFALFLGIASLYLL